MVNTQADEDRFRFRRFDETGAHRRRVLNTGSGPLESSRLHPAFNGWTHVRLDIDPAVKPDLVGSICNMRLVAANESFDAVWASHNLEHLHTHDLGKAIGEFRRILKSDGFALITCPDLEAIAEAILKRGATAILYESPAGPITSLDMLFGHGSSIAAGNHFMSHHTGFTQEVLGEAAIEAGFAEARVGRGGAFDLWALLLMPATRMDAVAKLFESTREHYLVSL